MEGSSWAVTTEDPPAAIGQVDEVKLAAKRDELVEDGCEEQRMLVDSDLVGNLEFAEDTEADLQVGLMDRRPFGWVDEAHGGFL